MMAQHNKMMAQHNERWHEGASEMICSTSCTTSSPAGWVILKINAEWGREGALHWRPLADRSGPCHVLKESL